MTLLLSEMPTCSVIDSRLKCTRPRRTHKRKPHRNSFNGSDRSIGFELLKVRNLLTTLTLVETEFDSFGGVNGLNRVENSVMSADGKHLYATANSNDSLVVFSRDAATGILTHVQTLLDTSQPDDTITALDTAFGVDISPDGKHVYVAAGPTGSNSDPQPHTDPNSLLVFSRNTTTEALTLVQTLTGNAEPSITVGADQTDNEDSGAQSVANFATGFDPSGGADDAGQSIRCFDSWAKSPKTRATFQNA